MTDKIDRLKKLDNDKLMDVVKNYRQYGYDNHLRETAIHILEARGISKEQLQLAGSFDNKTYDHANDLFSSFRKNSKVAFVMYLILLIGRVMVPLVPDDSEVLAIAILIVTIISFTIYLIFLILSFVNQNQFYKAIGQDDGGEGALLYFFIGLPFYLFLYFYFFNQMKDKLKGIK